MSPVHSHLPNLPVLQEEATQQVLDYPEFLPLLLIQENPRLQGAWTAAVPGLAFPGIEEAIPMSPPGRAPLSRARHRWSLPFYDPSMELDIFWLGG